MLCIVVELPKVMSSIQNSKKIIENAFVRRSINKTELKEINYEAFSEKKMDMEVIEKLNILHF